ncbi:MAG: class I SAM-dependent methyltransferase [Bryobacteraceae bacterium]
MDALSPDAIARAIAEIAPSLHGAGTFSRQAFDAIVRHCRGRDIRCSAETGSGASTLLFSHLSQRHIVFALDDGSGSVANVRRSPLLRAGAVTFVEGPTQVTLPRAALPEKLQLVLLDGPHAYPFPDLEYYFLYPHLEAGALLILDDIHIRSVHNLFRFLREDAMFRLDEVVATTAFFTRTQAPVFNPFGDGWQEQNYNAQPLFRRAWKERVKGLAPKPMLRAAARFRRGLKSGRCRIEILSPRAGETVGQAGEVEGSAEMPDGGYLWVLAHRRDLDGWWPQGGGPVSVNGGRWKASVRYGDPQDAGHEFEVAALAVGKPTHELWTDWAARVEETGACPPVRLPPAEFVRGEAYRVVRRSR